MKKIRQLFFLSLMLALAFEASACGNATPPIDLNSYSTQVAGTVIAQITQTAAAYTPPSTSTPTRTPTPTITPTPALSPTPNPNNCDNAIWVADFTIPDGTHVSAGQQFVKTWTIKNTGTCTWTTAYTLNYGYGEKMNGASTAISKDVPPSGSIEVSVTLTAPATVGAYKGYWRLSNANGYFFGEFLSVSIVVP